MAKTNIKLIIILTILIFINKINAQEIQVIDLDYCIKIISDKNFNLKESKINIELTREKIIEANKSWRPVITGFYNGFYDIYQVTHEDDHNHKTIKHLHYDQSNVFGIEANIDIYNFNKRKYIKNISILDNIIAHYDSEIKKDEALIILFQLYYDVLINKELLNITKKNKENISTLLEITRRKYELGAITNLEFSQVEQEYNNSLYDYQQKEFQLKLAKFYLANFVQLDIPLNRFDVLKESEDITGLYKNEIIQEIIQESPYILMERSKLEMIEQQNKLYKTNKMPRFEAFMSLGTSSQFLLSNQNRNNSLYTQWGNNMLNRIGISLTIPIMNDYKEKSIIKQTKILAERQKNNIDRKKNDIYKNIYAEIINIDNYIQLIEIAKKKENVSRSVYEMALKSFEMGSINIYELNRSRLDHIISQTELVQLQLTNNMRKKIMNVYIRNND